MPPRKSTASNPPEDGAEPGPAPTKASKEKDGLGVEVRAHAVSTMVFFLSLQQIQDLTLPKSMIARLAKGVLPANTQIQKDALLAMHKSATVFVSYIASKYAHSYAVLLHAPTCFRKCLPANGIRLSRVFTNTMHFSSNDLARMSNKKTISPQDVMSALKDAELEGFLPRLEAELKSTSHLSTYFVIARTRSTNIIQSTTTHNATSATPTAIV